MPDILKTAFELPGTSELGAEEKEAIQVALSENHRWALNTEDALTKASAVDLSSGDSPSYRTLKGAQTLGEYIGVLRQEREVALTALEYVEEGQEEALTTSLADVLVNDELDVGTAVNFALLPAFEHLNAITDEFQDTEKWNDPKFFSVFAMEYDKNKARSAAEKEATIDGSDVVIPDDMVAAYQNSPKHDQEKEAQVRQLLSDEEIVDSLGNMVQKDKAEESIIGNIPTYSAQTVGLKALAGDSLVADQQDAETRSLQTRVTFEEQPSMLAQSFQDMTERAKRFQVNGEVAAGVAGTTASVVIHSQEGLTIGNIGDSSVRLIYQDNDDNWKVQPLTSINRPTDVDDFGHLISHNVDHDKLVGDGKVTAEGITLESSHAIGDLRAGESVISQEASILQYRFSEFSDMKQGGRVFSFVQSDGGDALSDNPTHFLQAFEHAIASDQNPAEVFKKVAFAKGSADNITFSGAEITNIINGTAPQDLVIGVYDGHTPEKEKYQHGAQLAQESAATISQSMQGRAILSQARKLGGASLQKQVGEEISLDTQDQAALQHIVQVLAAAKNARGGDEEQPVLQFNKEGGEVLRFAYSEDAGWGVQDADANRSRTSSVSVPEGDFAIGGNSPITRSNDATINREGESVMKNGNGEGNTQPEGGAVFGTGENTVRSALHVNDVDFSDDEVGSRDSNQSAHNPMLDTGGKGVQTSQSEVNEEPYGRKFQNLQYLDGNEFGDDESVHSVAETKIPFANSSRPTRTPLVAPPPSSAATKKTRTELRTAATNSQQTRDGRPTLEPRDGRANSAFNATNLGNGRTSPDSSDGDDQRSLLGGGRSDPADSTQFPSTLFGALRGKQRHDAVPNRGLSLDDSDDDRSDAGSERGGLYGREYQPEDFRVASENDRSHSTVLNSSTPAANPRAGVGSTVLNSPTPAANPRAGVGPMVLNSSTSVAPRRSVSNAGGTVPPVQNPVPLASSVPRSGGGFGGSFSDDDGSEVGAPVVTSGPGTGAPVERAIAEYAATLKKEFGKALAKDLDRSSINPRKNVRRLDDKLVTELADAVARTHAEEGLNLGDNAAKTRASKAAAANVAQYYASETGKASPQIGKLNHTQLLEELTYAAVNGGADAQHALRESLYKSEAEAISKTSLQKGNWGLTGTRDTIAATLKKTFEENDLDIIALTRDHDTKLAFRKKIRAAVDNNQGEYLAPAIKGAVESFVGEQTSAQGVTSQGNGQGTPQPSGDARGGGSRSASPNTVAPESEQEPEREQMSPHDLHKKEAELKEAKRKQDRLEEKGRPKALMTGKAAVGTLVGAVFLGLITGGIGFLVVGAIGAAFYGIDKYRKSSYEKKLNKVAVQVADKADAIKEAKQGGGKERTSEPARSEGIDSGVADKLDALQARLDVVERENAALQKELREANKTMDMLDKQLAQSREANRTGRSSPTGIDQFFNGDDHSFSDESYSYGKGSGRQPHRPYLEEEDHFVSAAHNPSSRHQSHQLQYRSSTSKLFEDDQSSTLSQQPNGQPTGLPNGQPSLNPTGILNPPVSTRGNGGISQEVKNQARKATSNVEGVSEEKGGASNTHARNLETNTVRPNSGRSSSF